MIASTGSPRFAVSDVSGENQTTREGAPAADVRRGLPSERTEMWSIRHSLPVGARIRR